MSEKKLTRTGQIYGRKVSIAKVEGIDVTPKKRQVLGWEINPPRSGAPYQIWLGEGSVLITSPVQYIKRIEDVLIIQTRNSVYQIRQLEEKTPNDQNVFESEKRTPPSSKG